MTSNIEHKNYTPDEQRKLFDVLAENLKLPLLTIARNAELAMIQGDVEHIAKLHHVSESALQLIDHYLLSSRIEQAGSDLVLEPVSVSASLNEVAHRLAARAKSKNCDLEVHIAGRYEPIMAHALGLLAALETLGQILLDAQGQIQHTTRPVLRLAAHKTRHGIVAGMFAQLDGLSPGTLRRAHQLHGQSRSPLLQLTNGGGAEVFVAESLLKNMSSGLRVARYQKLPGLAATFTPSHQLELV